MTPAATATALPGRLTLEQTGPSQWLTDDQRWAIERLHMKGGDKFRVSDLYGDRRWETETFEGAVAVLEKASRSKVKA